MATIRKILKYAVAAVVCSIIVVLASALLYREYLQHKVAQERTISSPDGINSLEAVRIGGIDQWIQVRGQNVNNPILLFIHGGPGHAFIPLAGAFQGPWEKHFTVVQWDQRGAGKTYASNDRELLRKTMTVPRMQQDALEVVNYLRDRFKREKIFVLGHSWGSVLGLWLAHEHPDLINAYVGVAQLVHAEQNAKLAYEDALEEARKRRNDEAIKQLESIAPYPSESADLMKGSIAQQWEAQLLGPAASGVQFLDIKRLLTDIVSTPEYSLSDDYAYIRGQVFSLQTMIPQVTKLDLTRLGSDFRMPIFFFQGRQDPYSRPSLIQKYSQAIEAPRKEFISFDSSGHFPFFEERQKFLEELVQRVLPLANQVAR